MALITPTPANGATIRLDQLFGGTFVSPPGLLRSVVVVISTNLGPDTGGPILQAHDKNVYPNPVEDWTALYGGPNFPNHSLTISRAGGVLGYGGKVLSGAFITPWVPGAVITLNWQLSSFEYDIHNNPSVEHDVTEVYSFTLAAALPYGRSFDPLPDAVDVATDTRIMFSIAVHRPQTISRNFTTVKVRVNGGSQVTAYATQTWQNGYLPHVSSPIHDDTGPEDTWSFDIVPPAPFPLGALVEVEVTGQDNLSQALSPAVLYSFTIEEPEPPYVRSQTPAPNAVGVAEDTQILLTVAVPSPWTVVLGSIVIRMTVDSGPAVIVYEGIAFQPGYSGTATHGTAGGEDFYDFVLVPDVSFPSGAVVELEVEAENDRGTAIDPAVTYHFTIAVVVIPIVSILPATDTLRGGRPLIAATAMQLLDVSRDAAWAGLAHPDAAAWTPALAGAGSITPSRAGLVFDSGLAAGGSAFLASVATFQHFDVAVDVELVAPIGAPTGPVELAVLEAWSATGAVARVLLQRGVGSDLNLTAAFSQCSGPGLALTGGVAVVEGSAWTLRIVRNGARIFGSVGRRDARDPHGVYTEEVDLLDFSGFPPSAGVVKIGLKNLTVAARVRTRVRNFTVRSHATIAGRLLREKADLSTRRLIGRVPPAPVEDLGDQPIILFGLFGVFEDPVGFTYVLPVEKTVGAAAVRTLFTVQDPILRNGG